MQRKFSRAVLVAVTGCATVLSTAVAVAPADAGTPARASAQPAPHAQRAGGGYTWELGRPSVLPAGGLRVLVIRGRHATSLTNSVRKTVRQQRHYGVPLRFAGATHQRRVKNAIVIYNYGGKVCHNANQVGYGGFRYYTDGAGRVTWYGYVKVCALAYTFGNLLGVILHEVGHAVGLGHYTKRFHGKLQIMYPVIHRGVHSYRLGDANGLRAIARHVQGR